MVRQAEIGSTTIDGRSRTDLIRGLAVGSIAGQLIWLVIVVVAGLLEPGYSEVRDAVSVLGARDAARPWLFDTGGGDLGSLLHPRRRWRWRSTPSAAGAAGSARA